MIEQEENLKRIDDLAIGEVAGICDHTFLNRTEAYKEKAKITGESAVRLREKAFMGFLEETASLKYKPLAICVRPEDIRHARKFLDRNNGKGIVIASVVGFPDGCWYGTDFKLAEIELAADNGAGEIDFVLNYRKLQDRELAYVEDETDEIKRLARGYSLLTKMILETSELTDAEIKIACEIAGKYRIDFVKTSTGFSSAGAKPGHLKLMRRNFPRGVKMSGGVAIDNYKELLRAASGRADGQINLNPYFIRIGESGLLTQLNKSSALS